MVNGAGRNGATTPDLAVRPATADDVTVLARIWHQGWGDAHQGNVPEALYAYRTEDSYPARVRDRLPRTLVADRAGLVLGFVVVVDDEVEQVYVDRAARGAGVARALLGRAEQVIAGRGHRTAWLAVVAANAPARTAYERTGWVDSGPVDYDAEVPGGTIPVPCRRYEKALPG